MQSSDSQPLAVFREVPQTGFPFPSRQWAPKGGLFVLAAKLTDMHPPVKALHRRGQIFVALAALAWSFAGVLQRGLKLDIATQAASRSGVAFLALVVVVIVEARRTKEPLWSFLRAPGWHPAEDGQ